MKSAPRKSKSSLIPPVRASGTIAFRERGNGFDQAIWEISGILRLASHNGVHFNSGSFQFYNWDFTFVIGIYFRPVLVSP